MFGRINAILCLLLSVGACYGAEIVIPEIDVNNDSTQQTNYSGASATFDQQTIQQQGAISILDFLSKQGLTQLQEHSSQQNQTAISIHGFGNNASANTLILVDGVPMSSFTAIGPNLDTILLGNLSTITILPGSYGTLYGDQAVGGVVEINTTIPDTPTTDVSAGFGNMMQGLGQVYISRRLTPQIKASIAGMVYHTDNSQPHNKQNNYDLNSQLQYTGEQDTVKLSIYAYNNNIQIPDPIIWGGEPVVSTVDNYSDLTGFVSTLQNKLMITDNARWNSSVSLQGSSTEGVVNIPFTSQQKNALWFNRFFYKQWLNAGFDLQSQSYQLENTQVDNHVVANEADIFSQVTLPATKTLSVILGARYAFQAVQAEPTPDQSMHSTSGVPVNEEGIVWHFRKNWRYYLRRDTNYRFAKADEKVWVASNVTELQTQTGTSYETGVHWNNKMNKFSLGIYRLDLTNEIAYDPQPTQDAPFGKMSNLDPTRRIGLDMLGSVTIKQRVRLGTQLSLVDPYFTEGVDKGNQIPSVSKVNASASATYLGRSKWSFNVTEAYHSSFYATTDNGNNGDKMPGYFITSVNAVKHWKALAASLEIDNLFDKNYVRFADYFAAPSPSIQYYPADGIRVLFKVTVNLSKMTVKA